MNGLKLVACDLPERSCDGLKEGWKDSRAMPSVELFDLGENVLEGFQVGEYGRRKISLALTGFNEWD